MAEDLPIGEDLIWEEVFGAGRRDQSPGRRRAALFLDRDGVLNEEVGYLGDPEMLRLIPGSAEVVAEANQLEIPVVIVTNQGGIGRGELSWGQFAAVQRRLESLLSDRGAVPDMVLACPFHELAPPPFRHSGHPDRKPRPGMLRRAAAQLEIELSRSWIVGDSARDVLAGEAAGLAGGVLVSTGHGPQERAALDGWEPGTFCFKLRECLADCRDLLYGPLAPAS